MQLRLCMLNATRTAAKSSFSGIYFKSDIDFQATLQGCLNIKDILKIYELMKHESDVNKHFPRSFHIIMTLYPPTGDSFYWWRQTAQMPPKFALCSHCHCCMISGEIPQNTCPPSSLYCCFCPQNSEHILYRRTTLLPPSNNQKPHRVWEASEY